jgi:CheY-like chemotaxis protein
METPTAPAPLTILMVEDNPEDLYIMNWVLKAQNLAYDLHVIDNGDHALAYVHQLAHEERRRALTIVLLDLRQPQVDGKEVLRQIKTLPHVSDIPVVIVTSSTNPTDRRETLALGADAYFVKPYHLHEFMWLGEVIKHLVFGHPPSFTQHI